jgi:MarR-like DNA-binding transcriptional regulator SgrR of sgrS sRNA
MLGSVRARPWEVETGVMAESNWTFLTNHGHVFVALAKDPTMRLRDVAEVVGITERAVQSIVADLEESGYLQRTRVGRRNRYELHLHRPLRHPVEANHLIGELVRAVAADAVVVDDAD